MVGASYDVIVAGGGSAGVVAAVQAARMGARTLLIEKSGLLGGTAVLNEVNLPGLFHAWGKQVIAGIGWEWVENTMRESGKAMPDFSRFRELRHWKLQIPVDRAIYACVADRLAVEAGVSILFHTMLASAKQEDSGAWTLQICCKEGLREVHAKVLVDCTGDANLVRLAGGALRREPVKQPGTLMMQVGGFSYDELDLEALDAALERATARGDVCRADFHGNPARSFLLNKGANAMHVVGVNGETSEGKSDAELKARQALFRIYKFYRAQPGLENFKILTFAAECGIRETAIIEGETCVTTDDYTSGRIYSDAICHSFYPIDLHLADGTGIDIRPLKEGVVPTLPLGALLPRGTTNLIAAGRMACGEQLANSAYRVQASCMAMGQAAGAASALAAAADADIREVPLSDIHHCLEMHQAIVPQISPVPEEMALSQ